MKSLYLLLFALLSTTVSAQNFPAFVKRLNVAYTCVPNKSPDYFKYAFLDKDSKAQNNMYKLKSKAVFKNTYGQKTYLRYYLSYYLFGDTTECKKAVEKFFFEERRDGLKYMVNGPVKTPPMVMIFNSKSIYCMYGECETELDPWERLKKAFIKQYAEDKATLMIAKCGSVRWETYSLTPRQ